MKKHLLPALLGIALIFVSWWFAKLGTDAPEKSEIIFWYGTMSLIAGIFGIVVFGLAIYNKFIDDENN